MAAADDQRERRRLHAAIRLSKGFSLLEAYCDRPLRAEEEIRALEEALPSLRGGGARLLRMKLDLARAEEASDERLEAYLAAIVTPPLTEPGERLLVLDASRALSPERDRWGLFFRRLNAVRNAATRALACPFVLFMPLWMEPVFAENAPDWWSIRSPSVRWDEGERTPDAATPRAVAPTEEEPAARRERMLARAEEARAAIDAGRGEDAARLAAEAVALARVALAGAGGRLEPLRDLGDMLEVEARALRAVGRHADALGPAKEAVARTKELVARTEGRAAWSAALAAQQGTVADVLVALRRWDEAVPEVEAAVAYAQDALARVDTEEGARRAAASALALARVHAARGDKRRAREALTGGERWLSRAGEPLCGDAERLRAELGETAAAASGDAPADAPPDARTGHRWGREGGGRRVAGGWWVALVVVSLVLALGALHRGREREYQRRILPVETAYARLLGACHSPRAEERARASAPFFEEARRLERWLRGEGAPRCACDYTQARSDGCDTSHRAPRSIPAHSEVDDRLCQTLRRTTHRALWALRTRCPADAR